MCKKNLWLVIIVIFLVLVLLPVTPQRAVRLWLVKDFQPAAAFRVKLQSDPVAVSEYDQPRYTSENMERYRVDAAHYLPLCSCICCCRCLMLFSSSLPWLMWMWRARLSG